ETPVVTINQARSIPSINNNFEPISNRFSDRTITQACTLLLRESGTPLHVNELYNLLIAGGMKFKGNNPTISIAVSLNRNRRFRKVDPGTFDLVMREADSGRFMTGRSYRIMTSITIRGNIRVSEWCLLAFCRGNGF